MANKNDVNPAPYAEAANILGELIGLKGDGEKPKKPTSKKKLSGSELKLSDPEPWSEPVNGADLVRELADAFCTFVVLPQGGDVAVALWTLHAYVLEAVEVSAILAITSPVKRCGKTTLLKLLRGVTPRALMASNITPAAIFRTVEKYQPTLLVDELDGFIDGRDELRGILNSGHDRAGAFVVRTVGDDHEPRLFQTWCPKAVALIGKLPATLADRSIEIKMRRKSSKEITSKLRLDHLGDFEPLRRKAARWAQDNLEALKGADPEVPGTLDDRAQDNWRPLLAIADLAGGEWPTRAREVALALNGVTGEDDEAAIMLLEDLQKLFDEGGDRLATSDILDRLHEMEYRPWPEWRKGKPITSRQLARALEPFGIKPKVVRIGSETYKGYKLEDCEEAFFRYITGPNPSHGSQLNSDAGFGDFQKGNTGDDVTHRKQALTRDVTHVTFWDPLRGKKATSGQSGKPGEDEESEGPEDLEGGQLDLEGSVKKVIARHDDNAGGEVGEEW